jgi:hypothetical protein
MCCVQQNTSQHDGNTTVNKGFQVRFTVGLVTIPSLTVAKTAVHSTKLPGKAPQSILLLQDGRRQAEKLASDLRCLLRHLLLCLPTCCCNCLQHMRQQCWLVPAWPCFAWLYRAWDLWKQQGQTQPLSGNKL